MSLKRCGFTALVFATLATLGIGCDVGSLMYFLMPEAREPALLRNLPSDDPKSTPRVVILAWNAMETRAEFIGVEGKLCELLARELKDCAQNNEEKIEFVPQPKVEEFKNRNPNWRSLSLAAIGRRFKADYVVFLEINSMSLYERGSARELFKGRAELTVDVADVNKPDEIPDSETLTAVYPSEARGAIAAGLDTTERVFKQAFLAYLAKRLSWYFSRHPKRDTKFVE